MTLQKRSFVSASCKCRDPIDGRKAIKYSWPMETLFPKENEFTTHQQARASGHELLRRNVAEAASHLLVEEGPEALTVRRVSKALNSSTNITFTPFKAKHALPTPLSLRSPH